MGKPKPGKKQGPRVDAAEADRLFDEFEIRVSRAASQADNLACSYSNLEDVDAAFEALHRAFDLGYNDYRHLLRDPDLENLRKDRRFKSLLNRQWGKRQP